MKAKDLMIGDIVSVTPSSMLIKIAAIHRKKVAYHACNNSFLWVRVGLLQPISLTPEILEQNGFKYYDSPVLQMQNKLLMTDIINGHYIEIRLDRKEMAIWYDYDENNDGVYSDCLFPLPYWLHDFQHALRLCGINKEIKL